MVVVARAFCEMFLCRARSSYSLDDRRLRNPDPLPFLQALTIAFVILSGILLLLATALMALMLHFRSAEAGRQKRAADEDTHLPQRVSPGKVVPVGTQ